MRFHPMIHAVDVVVSKRMHIMNVKCPQCGGRLIEKHEEVETERGKEVVFVFFRCVKCGKWVKRERSSNMSTNY